MKLSHPAINSCLDNKIGIDNLIIENKKFFRECILDLKNQQEGGAGNFILQNDDGELIDISSHMQIITDPFSISLNQKNILGRVIKNLEEEINSSFYDINLGETISHLSDCIKHAGNSLGINLYFRKNNLDSILHALDIHIQVDNQNDLLGQLLDFMEFTSKAKEDIFILVNLHSLFTPNEMERFLYDCHVKELQIFLIENRPWMHLPPGSSIIIGEDLCEF